MEYMTVKEAAEKWNTSVQVVRRFCRQERIAGVVQQLLGAAHTRKHHFYVGQAGGEPYRPAGDGRAGVSLPPLTGSITMTGLPCLVATS